MFRIKHKLHILCALAGLCLSLATSLQPVAASSRVSASGSPVAITFANSALLPRQTPSAVLLTGINQEYQGWNNCGPATLKMNLSYFGKADTQQEIAAITKPNYNDKSVSAQELAGYAQRAGLGAIVRENGSVGVLRQLVSSGLPVIIESGYLPSSGWMSHFLLLIGYDEQQMTFMDSYAGPDQSVSYDAMEARWREVNRRYLVVFPPEKEQAVRAILGDELNDAVMYTRAVELAHAELAANPKDAFAYYNLGTNLIGLGDAQAAASAFDQARKIGLPWRMMWYQYGAYVAYLNTGRYQDVIVLANSTLRTVANLEEAHYYKGMALKSLGQLDAARREFRTALRYNPNYQEAQSALESV